MKEYKKKKGGLRKNYTAKQRFNYHQDRDRNCDKYGIKFGSPKHCYSFGFIDGFEGMDNSHAVKREFGDKASKSYNFGLIRGKRAGDEYFKTTGKQPLLIDFD